MTASLLSYRDKPIGDLEVTRELRDGYRDVLIDTAHPLHAEACGDARSYGLEGVNHYYRSDNPPYYEKIPNSLPTMLLRVSVLSRLKAINDRLSEIGLELFLFDGLRPTQVQEYMYKKSVPDLIRRLRPGLTEDELWQEVGKYCASGSPTSDKGRVSPSPHLTGAAVDLTVRNKHLGDHLYMGSVFDELTDLANPDYFERKKLARSHWSVSDEEALRNRRLLYWLMQDLGFANNPTEWWHFSWGDQLWAHVTCQPRAIYGAARQA